VHQINKLKTKRFMDRLPTTKSERDYTKQASD